MASVTVRGSATHQIAPDRLRVRLTLQAEAPQAAAAMDDLAGRSAQLDRILDEAGDAVASRRPSSVWVSPRYDYDGRQQVLRAQVAVRSVLVELLPAPNPGELLRRLVGETGTTVGEVEWVVDDASPARDRVRAAAAADATARADVYAAAVGMRLGLLEWLAEPGLRVPRTGGGPVAEAVAPRVAAMSAPAPAEGTPLDLQPEPVAVTATVEASYALLPGTPDQGGNYL